MSSKGRSGNVGQQAVLTDYFSKGKRNVVDPPSAKLRKTGDLESYDTLKTPAMSKFDGETPPSPILTVRKRKQPVPREHRPSPARFPKRNLRFGDDEDGQTNESPSLRAPSPRIVSPLKIGVTSDCQPAPSKVIPSMKPVRNVAALQKRLAEFSNSAARLNVNKTIIHIEDPQLSPVKAQQLSIPTSRAIRTPEKVSISQSSEKFADQVRKDLPLPLKHAELLDAFRGTETVVSIRYNRDEIITYEKLKQPIQIITKRNFLKKHLAQIKQVYPESYSFDIKKTQRLGGGTIGPYNLMVKPNLESDLFKYTCRTPMKSPVKPGMSLSLPKSPTKVGDAFEKPNIYSGDSEQKRKFTGEHQNVRRHVFRTNLLKHVHQHHKKFLESLQTPIKWSEQDFTKCVRWHPKFKLESVPEIVEAILPEAPKEERLTSARKFLNHDSIALGKKIDLAVASVANKIEQEERLALKTEPAPVKEESKPLPVVVKNTKSNGISRNLLELIRAKEAAKKKEDLTRDPIKELREKRLKRLPDLYRIMRTYFLTKGSNKSTLPMQPIIVKLAESCAFCRDEGEMLAHVELMLEIIPDHVNKLSSREIVYIKLDLKTNIQSVIDKLKHISA